MKKGTDLLNDIRSSLEKSNTPATTPSTRAVPARAQQAPAPAPIDYGQPSGLSLQHILDRYNREQKLNIVRFFEGMVKNFSTTFTHMYGTEPDAHFAEFAANLSHQDFNHISAHLNERLESGIEWPPNPGLLAKLKDLPLKKEMSEARYNILTMKTATTRVERYIMKRKSTRLRSLSERHLKEEFEEIYKQAYNDVKRDEDLRLDELAARQQHALLAHNAQEQQKLAQRHAPLDDKFTEILARTREAQKQQPKSQS